MIKKNKLVNKLRFLKAVEIQPKDDSFHGNIRLLDIEWWYFDAVFNNGYSVHVGFRVYHIKKFGIVQSRINIYKDGKAIAEEIKIHPFSKFFINPNFPTIKIKNNSVVIFNNEVFKKNKEWEYKVKLSINNNSIDLLFTGLTKGWKIETSDTCWVVPLPKASVTGEITVNNKKIKVEGIGYHDHNWSYSPTTAMNNIGWFWGRISSNSMNITWAKTIQDADNIDIIAVLNIDNGDFFNINPENIKILTNKFEKNNGAEIPKFFKITIKDHNTNGKKIEGQITMNALDLQYSRIFTIKYWRYHMRTNGRIIIGDMSEDLVDKPQIIEFLKFKSKNIY